MAMGDLFIIIVAMIGLLALGAMLEATPILINKIKEWV